MRRLYSSSLWLMPSIVDDLVAPDIAWGDEVASDAIPFPSVSRDGKVLTFGRAEARALRRRAAKRAS